MSRTAARNWSQAILDDLHEHGENSVYGLASNLGVTTQNLYPYIRAMADSGRVIAMTSNEFQDDGSSRMIYFLPEQHERWRSHKKYDRAFRIAKDCIADAVLLDCLVGELVKVPGFDAALALYHKN